MLALNNTQKPEDDAVTLAPIKAPRVSVFFLVVLLFVVGAVSVFFLSVEAVINGTGVVESGRGIQSIKSQEGGILNALYVREGQTVEAGTELALLSNVAILARRTGVEGDLHTLRAKAHRLELEKQGITTLKWPQELEQSIPAEIRQIQADLFATRNRRFTAELSAIKQEIATLNGELSSVHRELSALAAERDTVQSLLNFRREGQASGFVSRADVLQAESQYAQISREQARLSGRIPTLRSQIAETNKRLQERESQQRQAILDEADENQTKLRAAEAEISAATDRDERRVLRSPVDAVINTIHVRGVGDVVSPAEPIIDILPLGQGLIVKAKIDPAQRRGLYENLPAKVSFTALQDLRVAPMDGTVIFVAPDIQTENDGRSYYEIHIQTEADAIPLPQGGTQRIEPGMQATVSIIVGEHSVADFLLSPFEWIINNAFRQR